MSDPDNRETHNYPIVKTGDSGLTGRVYVDHELGFIHTVIEVRPLPFQMPEVQFRECRVETYEKLPDCHVAASALGHLLSSEWRWVPVSDS